MAHCSPAHSIHLVTLLMQSPDASMWVTFRPGDSISSHCQGPTCQALTLVECLSPGAKPLVPDARGNVGCGNKGAALPARPGQASPAHKIDLPPHTSRV